MEYSSYQPEACCRLGTSRGRLAPLCFIAFILAGVLAASIRADRVTFQDMHGDAVARRTDTGANGPIDQASHKLPDLLSWSIGTWRPNDAQADLFSGTWANTGDFFRLELVFDGVMNPPGPLGCCGEPEYQPYRYGPNPLSGYIEIDMDADADTGGELDWPNLRYLGNTSRFGGLPQQVSVRDRAAVDGSAFDSDLVTPPYVERSGEDFHVELVGWEVHSNLIQRSDTSDWLFGSGETWVVSGYLFHRAYGYSQFSSACCRPGVPIGNYDPLVKVQFSHSTISNRTTVSLVYPLTNTGSAAMTGSPIEDADVRFDNQNSVSEALWELVISASAATALDRMLPEFALIAPWENKDPDECLDPTLWRVTVLVGGSYTSPQDSMFVWSDIYPDVKLGDFNGDAVVNSADLGLSDVYMPANDGSSSIDADGQVNGSIEIAGFGPGFSLYDLNYDGLVDGDDRSMSGGPLLPRGDFDRDGDLDLVDFAHLQSCVTTGSGPGTLMAGCRNADLDRDWDVDQDDVTSFVGCASGPSIPANPACGRN